MSIFTAIFHFIANLFSGIAKEYEKLDPVVKADIDTAMQATQVIKLNLDKDAPAVLALIEQQVGSFAADKVTAILNQVAADLGIKLTGSDKLNALVAIMDHLRPKEGSDWMDAVFNVAKYIAINLSGGTLTRNIAIVVIQFVYDHIFKPSVPIAVTEPAPAATVVITAPVPVVNEPAAASQGNAIVDQQDLASQNSAMLPANESPEPIPETPGFLEGSYTPPAKPVDPAAESFLTPGAYTPPA